MIDLHLHSNYSDGTSSIEDIIDKANELGLSQIAITDHNFLFGSIVASEISNIDFVVGTELSVDYQGTEIHLLAYFPDGSKTNYKNTQFVITEGEAYKRIAMLEMIENLNKMGFEITVSELAEFSKGIVNRVHICKAMIKHGYIQSVEEGFKKYVGENCPAYVERKTVSIYDAAKAIHNDGGIAVVAHPYEYEDDLDIYSFLTDIRDSIDGIECFHPSANTDQQKILVEIAETYNKLITGGSDFHGSNKKSIYMNMMHVDDKYRLKKSL